MISSRILRVAGVHRPSPSLLYYPGLTSQPWYSRDDIRFAPWLEDLEAAVPAISSEYERVCNEPSDYESDATHSSLHTGESQWHWASLIDRGQWRPRMIERCPETAAALKKIPGLCVGHMPFSFAFFSTLNPHSRIVPHFSPANLRIRVHLPLKVPKYVNTSEKGEISCGIRVAGESRQWEEGKCLM